ADGAAHVDRGVDGREHRLRALLHPPPRDESGGRGQRAPAGVPGPGHVLAEGELLVDHADPGLERVAGVLEAERAAVEQHLARVGGMDAGEQLAERALARAVLATERVAGAGVHVEADALEGDHAREALADALEADQRWHTYLFTAEIAEVRR